MKPSQKTGPKKKNFGCTIDGCDRPALSKTMCSTHYSRQWRGADVNAPVQSRPTPPVRQDVIADIKAGLTLIEASQKYNLNIGSISRMFKKYEGIGLREWKKQHAS